MELVSNHETIAGRFQALNNARASIRSKVFEYAHYTLPWLMPSSEARVDIKFEEMAQPAGSVGARAVNHLANRLVTALFIPNKPFFRMTADERGYQLAEAEGISRAQLDSLFSMIEHNAVKVLDSSRHRTQAVLAVKNLLVTGNALLYYDVPNMTVYNFHDYVLQRELDGTVKEIITSEEVLQDKLPESTRLELEAQNKLPKKNEVSKTTVTLYTRVYREYSGRDYVWRVKQEVEGGIDATLRSGLNEQYTKDELPWIALAWNLCRGDDYGRGLVEDYVYAFHAHETFSAAQMQLFAMMTDRKWFVTPGTITPADLEDIVKSAPGTYHELSPEALWTPQFATTDISVVEEKIAALEREISQAFMLNTTAVRQAERVTAEEIRMITSELETSLGGSYSSLAAQWQGPLATLLLASSNAKRVMNLPGVSTQVVTGIESFSRAGELDSLRQALADMAGIASMPPDALARLQMSNLWTLVLSLHGLDPAKFIKSEEEYQAEQQAIAEATMAQQTQLQEQQFQGQAALELAKGM